MSPIDVVRCFVSMSTTIGAMPRDGRRTVSRTSSRRIAPGSAADPQVGEGRPDPGAGQHLGASSGVVHGTSDSRQATCTGSSAEFTRASTAMSVGFDPLAPARRR